MLRYIGLAVDYGAEHLGRTMAAIAMEAVKISLKKRYKCQISAANWRGLADLILDRTKYVGSGHIRVKRTRIMHEMMDKADVGEYFDM